MRMAVQTRTSLDFGLLYLLFKGCETHISSKVSPTLRARQTDARYSRSCIADLDRSSHKKERWAFWAFISSWSWFDQQPLRLESWTGEAHFYAPAFSYVLRTKKGWEKDTALEVDAVSSTRKEAAPLKPITWRILWPDQVNDAQWQNPCSRELCFMNVLTKWAVLVTKVS